MLTYRCNFGATPTICITQPESRGCAHGNLVHVFTPNPPNTLVAPSVSNCILLFLLLLLLNCMLADLVAKTNYDDHLALSDRLAPHGADILQTKQKLVACRSRRRRRQSPFGQTRISLASRSLCVLCRGFRLYFNTVCHTCVAQ